MQFANVQGRAHVVVGEDAFDVEQASRGKLGSDPQALFEHWDAAVEWAASVDWATPPSPAIALDPSSMGAPSPRPRQVFGVGLNYRSHAAEANLELPPAPVIFTKFPSCLSGPNDDLPLQGDTVDWEIELVVTVGRGGTFISEDAAWAHLAGVSVGQDYSDRFVQGRPPAPQFSMGKSFPGFGPFGPTIVTPDELDDPNDLELLCRVNDIEVQHARTSDLIFSVPEIVAYLSSIITLYAGDVIFTGTPAGVGGARNPLWYLAEGDVIESRIDQVGLMRNVCVASATRHDTEPSRSVRS